MILGEPLPYSAVWVEGALIPTGIKSIGVGGAITSIVLKCTTSSRTILAVHFYIERFAFVRLHVFQHGIVVAVGLRGRGKEGGHWAAAGMQSD